MSRNLSKDELINHKENALRKLDKYLTSLINDKDSKIQSKSDKLSYWIEDWTTFLNFEPKFNASSLRRYKRGEIIKAHLGYNIGSEEGGLHYCVVLDNNNALTSPVITIVPLTSVKPTTDIHKLKKGSVYIGNELFTCLSSKISTTNKSLILHFDNLTEHIKLLNKNTNFEEYDALSSEIKKLQREKDLLENMLKEINKMKRGSIALTNQITTISKIRIFDPKTNYDILSNVKLSNDKLDLIDQAIIERLTKNITK